jgi:hypothetical protein
VLLLRPHKPTDLLLVERIQVQVPPLAWDHLLWIDHDGFEFVRIVANAITRTNACHVPRIKLQA